MLVAACLVIGASAGAAPADRAVNWVAAFVEESERALAAGGRDAVARVETVYRHYFDIDRLSERIAPEQFLSNADARQKRRFADIVACRLAAESVKRRKSEKLVSWKIAGTRPQPWGQTVAVRFVLSGDRQRTVLFDLASTVSGLRVVDASSESGRLSAEFAKQLARETRTVVEPSEVKRWLALVKCRLPRTP
jgi:hypothetical protein